MQYIGLYLSAAIASIFFIGMLGIWLYRLIFPKTEEQLVQELIRNAQACPEMQSLLWFAREYGDSK